MVKGLQDPSLRHAWSFEQKKGGSAARREWTLVSQSKEKE